MATKPNHASRGTKITARSAATATVRPVKKRKTLEISDSLLLKMLKSPVYRREFGFVEQTATELEAEAKTVGKKKGCGCRASSRIVTVPADRLVWMRRKIYAMPIKSKQRLKQLLQVDEVSVRTTDETGKQILLKF